MPELPEVETVRRGLHRLIIGKTVQSIDFDTPKSFPNPPGDVSSFLVGSQIKDVRRRAKVLLIDLSTDYTLVIHLKMTGQLVYVAKNAHSRWKVEDGQVASAREKYDRNIPIANSSLLNAKTDNVRFGAGHPNDSLIGVLPDRSTRVTIDFIDDSKLFFNDQRKFGWVKLFPTTEVPNIDFMRRVGPEPLEDSFTAEDFISRIIRRKGTTIKAAILDQTILAGVGNIYADESLWGAKIHPATRVRDVTHEQLAFLLQEIKSVMTLSIEKGGSTNRNYVDAEGKRGSYMTFANVFRREGHPCNRCGTVITKHKIAGRGTHICQTCQVVP